MILAIPSGWGIFEEAKGLNMLMDGFLMDGVFYDDLNLYPDLDKQPNFLSWFSADRLCCCGKTLLGAGDSDIP